MKPVYCIVLMVVIQIYLVSFSEERVFASGRIPDRFTVKEETIKDNLSNLIWFRHVTNEEEWSGTAKFLYNLKTDNKRAIANYNDWRMPTRTEIDALVKYISGNESSIKASLNSNAKCEKSCLFDGLVVIGFKFDKNGYCIWTSEPFKYDDDFVWYVSAYSDLSNDDLYDVREKNSMFGLGKCRVLLVRDGMR